jgi:hypothetical protein
VTGVLQVSGMVVAATLAAFAVLAPEARVRAVAMLGALVVTPVLLVGEVWGTPQLEPLRESPALAAGLATGGLAVVGALAVAIRRHPALVAYLALAALPFRVPVESGGATANLLVPLYAVIAAGVLAWAIPRLRGTADPGDRREPRALEWLLVGVVVLYALQSSYSSDKTKALEQVVFFYAPFALLFALLREVTWRPRVLLRSLWVLVGLALVFAAVGFWEFHTRELLLNPRVLSANQVTPYFRVNSLFFDPNIYGRYLALTMVAVAALLLWQRRPRDTAISALVLAVLWGGLVLTFSQSSFAALLVGLLVVACVRWRPWPILAAVAAAGLVALAVVLAAPGAVGIDTSSENPLDKATSGRFELLRGGLDMFVDRPIAGFGSGSFAERFRERENVSSIRASAASHTIPVTVAAEQGVIGLAAYGAVLFFAVRLLFTRLRWRSRRGPPSLPPLGRTIVAAAFAALVFHTMTYAAFLEDPITWTLVGLGIALRVNPVDGASASASEASSPAEFPESPSERSHTALCSP